jgi:hypothetical protein
MTRLAIIVVMVTSLAAAVPARAATACHATSEALTRPLVELYTSEGCDSCPPADRWFSSRFDPAGEHPHAIALAFHVDYWDRLGWVDRFADAAYTERQYQAMRANGASFVYTPQLLVQGHDLTDWRGGAAAAIDAAARMPARATITLDATPGAREVVVRADARVLDAVRMRDAQLFVAYADSGLVSDVKAGENRGVRLEHDHVVRALQRVGPPAADGHWQASVTLPKPAEAGRHPALVAFVQRAASGDVLQSVALPLDACALH